MIAPVVPPQSRLQAQLSATPVVRTADQSIIYGMCTVGETGRVVDKHAFTELGWRPGLRLELTPGPTW
ncbi:hypothetical protein [Nocardia amamiensis]|uniref:hypothetical protein n=1 Tax=Nocardia amamiensis TaxID=404578 RepID=UPI000ACE33BF|nr:hypothetical protein [Nocardia amamiensis]